MSISNVIKFNETGIPPPPGHLMMKAKSCLSKKIN
jgi:hypothetical protein